MSDEPSSPSGNPTPPSPGTGKSPSWVKVTLIKILRGIIGTLEGVVTQLETEQGQGETPSVLLKLVDLWQRMIRQIRSLLPPSWHQKLSDSALGGVLALILLVVITTTWSLLPSKSPEIATLPPSPSPSESPSIPEVIPSPSVTPSEIPTPSLPESSPTPTVSETPEPLLTPEQALIARVENSLKEISQPFGESLIAQINPNFVGSLLIVKMTDNWYTLTPNQQDTLVNQLWQASQNLDFSKLEIFNPQQTQIARNPVIGSNMIILERNLNQS